MSDDNKPEEARRVALGSLVGMSNSLTPSGVVLMAVAMLVTVLGYAAWETRSAVAQQFFASPFAIGMSLMVAVGALGSIGLSKMIARAEQRAENAVARAESSSRDREQALQRQIDMLNRENDRQDARMQQMQEQNNVQAQQLSACHSEHATAQREVARLALLVAGLKQ